MRPSWMLRPPARWARSRSTSRRAANRRPEMTSVLIVGGGLAGARCAETLRAAGFDGTLVLAGGESHAPYERPALSKELLSGARDAASLTLRDSATWPSAGIALRLGSPVVRID